MPDFPGLLWEPVHAVLQAWGDLSRISTVQALRGGYSNQVFRVTTAQATYVVKWHPQGESDRLAHEIEGLQTLQSYGVRVPQIIGSAQVPPILVLEWISPPSQRPVFRQRTGSQLGQLIATLHRNSRTDSPVYGWPKAHYFGSARFSAAQSTNWTTFFQQQRFIPQLQRADTVLSTKQAKQLWQLAQQLPERLHTTNEPVFIHGDVWAGNILSDHQGQPILIDPASLWADREAELAYAQLSGSLPASFFTAYNNHWPLAAGFTERAPLYQIPPILHIMQLGLFPRYATYLAKILLRYK